jgi:hypothetical protein
MTLTNVKQVVILTLQAGFVRMSWAHIYFLIISNKHEHDRGLLALPKEKSCLKRQKISNTLGSGVI